MMWLMFLFPVACLGLALTFLQGRGGWMLAGYVTLGIDRKAQYDEEGLCRYTGRVMLGMTGATALCAAGMVFEPARFLLYIGMVGVFVAIGASFAAVRERVCGGR